MAYKLLISQTGKLPDTRTLHLTITLEASVPFVNFYSKLHLYEQREQ